ncbi:MAG: PH domain-containing protein [Acidobacteriales bacterium]|nr:PH domain-containing protein [Terriglobales bacterium]
MADIMVRPTLKLVRFLNWVTFLLALAILIYIQNSATSRDWWMLIFPALIFVCAICLQIKRRFTVMTILGDKLRYETGVFSKVTRNIAISKVQDARVEQSIWQRIFGVGTLSIETAGETSRLTICGIDHPQEVAEHILDASQAGDKKDKGKQL